MLRLVLIFLIWTSAAWAEDTADNTARVAAFKANFQDWMDAAGIERGALAIRHNGAPIDAVAWGMDADAQVDLASLSKAITGVCVAALVEENRLTYDTQARHVLNLPNAAQITIGQLLSHATGLEKDHTQGPMAAWRKDTRPRWAEITPNALDPDRLIDGPPRYYYSNENYAVLGTVIEKVTGESYEDACRTRVLDPAGVTAIASPDFASFLPWGGWRMSVADYATFMDYAFGPHGILTDPLRGLPRIQLQGPIHYGLGILQRDWEDTQNVWHFGALCFFDGPNLGSYAVHWANGWTITAWYDACVSGAEMGGLDATMVNASFGDL